jgi:hypothetical protein
MSITDPSAVANDAAAPDRSRPLSLPDRLAVASAALFVVILAVAAYWDPSIRVLHLLEAVPFLLAAALITRQRRFGYLLGVASGAFWLWTAGFLTTFIKNGFERLASLMLTGHVDRWDIFIAVPAAVGTGGLVMFSLVSYLRSADKPLVDAVRFLGTCALVASFFVLILRLFAPQYLGMFGSMLPAFRRP